MAEHGMAWHGMACHGIILHGVILYEMAWKAGNIYLYKKISGVPLENKNYLKDRVRT
mgnify:CR=1 FL=1